MNWEFALFVIAAAFAATLIVPIGGMLLIPVVDGVCKILSFGARRV